MFEFLMWLWTLWRSKYSKTFQLNAWIRDESFLFKLILCVLTFQLILIKSQSVSEAAIEFTITLFVILLERQL